MKIHVEQIVVKDTCHQTTGQGAVQSQPDGITPPVSPKRFDEAAWRARVEATRVEDLSAPHRDAAGRFFNPWLPMEPRTADFWRWTFSRGSFGEDDAGAEPAPAVANDGAYLRDPDGNKVHIVHRGDVRH